MVKLGMVSAARNLLPAVSHWRRTASEPFACPEAFVSPVTNTDDNFMKQDFEFFQKTLGVQRIGKLILHRLRYFNVKEFPCSSISDGGRTANPPTVWITETTTEHLWAKSVSVNKVLLEYGHVRVSLSMATFALKQQSGVVASEGDHVDSTAGNLCYLALFRKSMPVPDVEHREGGFR